MESGPFPSGVCGVTRFVVEISSDYSRTKAILQDSHYSTNVQYLYTDPIQIGQQMQIDAVTFALL